MAGGMSVPGSALGIDGTLAGVALAQKSLDEQLQFSNKDIWESLQRIEKLLELIYEETKKGIR